MKIKSNLLSLWCMLAIAAALTACSKDDDPKPNDEGTKLTLPSSRVFILNEGSFKQNNAGITFYAPNKDGSFVADIYKAQNEKGLGDTGQDMILYNDYIYVSVYNSGLLLKLNTAGVEQKRLEFSKSDGLPRHIAAYDGKIYVVLYSGKVAKVDAETFTIEGYANVGMNPDGIAIANGYLCVANTGQGKDNTVTIIDARSLLVTNTIKVAQNPEKVLVSEGQFFIQAYGGDYPNYTYPVQRVDISTGTVTTIAKATNFCEYRGTIYMVYSDTDWKTHKTTNTFTSYDVRKGMVNSSNFLRDMPEELASESVYMMEVNPNNGDIYIGTSDYKTNGNIYRFGRNGKFIEKFSSGGINPNNAVFYN